MVDFVGKLILGTVQFGLNYGINNLSGRPSEEDVFNILDEASKQGIQYLDTADAYGNAMELIGHYHKRRNHRFKILNKFTVSTATLLSIQAENGLRKLHISDFEVYSYHSFADYWNHPALREELQTLKNRGLIKKIGISIYTNNELQQVVTDNWIDVIQLPYNLLDNQNIRGLYLEQAIHNHQEIHVRSVFLQGLFFKNPESLPGNLLPLKPYLQIIRNYCQQKSISLESLALNYALYNNNINRVLIGIDTKQQLLTNLTSTLDMKADFEFINQHIKVKETELLNPVNWG